MPLRASVTRGRLEGRATADHDCVLIASGRGVKGGALTAERGRLSQQVPGGGVASVQRPEGQDKLDDGF